MTRRAFLRNTSATAGALALGGLKERAYSQTTNVNQNLLSAASAAHVTAVSNCYGSSLTGVDFKNVSNSSLALLQNMQQAGLDSALQAQIASVTVQDLNQSGLAKASIVASVNSYQPSFGLPDLDLLYSLVPTDISSLTAALQTLQSQGLTPTISQLATRANYLCVAVNAASNGGEPTAQARVDWPFQRSSDVASVSLSAFPKPHWRPAVYQPKDEASVHRVDVTWQRIAPPPPSEGGGGVRYNCQADAALNLALGTTFLVLAFMAGPAGVLAETALWVGIATYGGYAAGAQAIGHAIFCGFEDSL